MRRPHGIFFLTITMTMLSLFPTQRADAQYRGRVTVGVGIYTGPRGYYGPGPYFGAYPLNYNGFYGNGMSMYGPPVPTYAPVPGTFGGSDYRVNQNAPLIGPGVGVYGTVSRSTREPATITRPTSPSPPADPNAEPPLLSDRVLNGTNSITVEVRVPIENATVFFNNQLVRTDGAVRVFSSPPLKPGNTYQYDIRAEWIVDGQKTSLTQTVRGIAGEQLVADFTK